MKYLIIILLLLVSGCLNDSILGTYIQNDSTITFQDDGTYLYSPKNSFMQQGTYTHKGNELKLTSAFGTTIIMVITKDGLLDDEGKVWVRI